MPGPACGNRTGQSFDEQPISTALEASFSTRTTFVGITAAIAAAHSSMIPVYRLSMKMRSR